MFPLSPGLGTWDRGPHVPPRHLAGGNLVSPTAQPSGERPGSPRGRAGTDPGAGRLNAATLHWRRCCTGKGRRREFFPSGGPRGSFRARVGEVTSNSPQETTFPPRRRHRGSTGFLETSSLATVARPWHYVTSGGWAGAFPWGPRGREQGPRSLAGKSEVPGPRAKCVHES